MTDATTDTPTPTGSATCSRCKQPCRVLFLTTLYPAGVCPACEDVLYRLSEDAKVERQELEDDDDGT